MAKPTHALVLSAGLGTRLQPLTFVRAKPAIPVAGEPLIRRILRWLASAGVTNIVINLHHLPHTIATAVGDGSDLGVHARYSWEQPRVLGSAGGPKQAAPIVGTDTFFVVNGDTLAFVDLDQLWSVHRSTNALVTLALTPNVEPMRYGGVRLDADSRVLGFVRRGPDAKGAHHFVGVQVVHAAAFDSAPQGEPANSIGEVYDRMLVDSPGAIRGSVSDTPFVDIGTIADYLAASRTLSNADSGAGSSSPRTRIDPSARVIDSVLWDEVEVAAHAVLDRCIVTDGVRVPPDAEYKQSVLRRDAAGAIIATRIPDADGSSKHH